MAAKPSPVPALEPEEAIRALAKEYETYYNARNVERLVGLFASDGRILPMFDKKAEGREQLRTRLQEGFDQFDPRNVMIETTHVEFSGDIAFSLGTVSGNVRLPDGSRQDDQGKWVAGLRRERGQWKLAALIHNTDLPMPGTR